MKKVCVVTAARSEYGLLRWTIDAIANDKDLQLQLVVTGGHLSIEQGLTYQFIEEDGYHINAKIPILMDSNSAVGIAKTMGVCGLSLADCFAHLCPDLIVVLGDRYELLPIVSTALVMRIPIAHVSGGDVTEGAIDNEVRNAVSMMSNIHFPGVQLSADNLRRMLGSEALIYNVGEPGLENFKRANSISREELAKSLDLDIDKKWMLVTLHPETKLSINENLEMVNNLFQVMELSENTQFVISKANTDLGGTQINKFWEDHITNDSSKYRLVSSLGQNRYLNYMKEVVGVLGNSSSGIVEAPFLGIPVLNIGNRQKGRHICQNVIECSCSLEDMQFAYRRLNQQPKIVDKYYGDGDTARKIVSHIKEYLKNNG